DDGARPWALVACGPCGRDLEAFARAPQRHCSRAPTDLAIDREGAAVGRRIACANHQCGTATILLEGRNRLGDGDERAVAQPAEQSSNGAAPNAAMRPTAPGKPLTQSATAVIQSMP